MKIDILCAVPDLLAGPFDHSMLKRAADRNLLEINVINLRKYGLGKHQQIDDYQYGGGAGMVMMIQPIFEAIEDLSSEGPYDEIIYLTPDGERYNQAMANELSMKQRLLLLCGHYKGVDQRVRDHLCTKEISLGDYVLSGGELAAAVLVDSIGRLLPGVLNDESSALLDSFQDDLLAPPVFTRPANFQGWEVPEVLLSGHEAAIAKWRDDQAHQRTLRLRPDLLDEADQ